MEKANGITIKQIKEELHDIRYYYSRKEMFDKAFDCTGKSEILKLIEKYNLAICRADPKLYELYIYLYVKNNTQETAAEELMYSVDYVARHNKRLLEFFKIQFST